MVSLASDLYFSLTAALYADQLHFFLLKVRMGLTLILLLLSLMTNSINIWSESENSGLVSQPSISGASSFLNVRSIAEI